MTFLSVNIYCQAAIGIERCLYRTKVLLIIIENKKIRKMLIDVPVECRTVFPVHVEDCSVFFQFTRLYIRQSFFQGFVHIAVDLLKYLIHPNSMIRSSAKVIGFSFLPDSSGFSASASYFREIPVMFFDAFLTKTFYQKSVLEKSEMRCTLRFQAGSEF